MFYTLVIRACVYRTDTRVRVYDASMYVFCHDCDITLQRLCHRSCAWRGSMRRRRWAAECLSNRRRSQTTDRPCWMFRPANRRSQATCAAVATVPATSPGARWLYSTAGSRWLSRDWRLLVWSWARWTSCNRRSREWPRDGLRADHTTSVSINTISIEFYQTIYYSQSVRRLQNGGVYVATFHQIVS